MAITASMVKELRDSTGAGMMDAKKALTETDGDMDAAIDWLRTKGLSKAAKKSGRTAAEGLVAVAVAGGTGVAVEVNAETDFVGKNDQFQTMVGAIAKTALAAETVDGLLGMEIDGKSVADTVTSAIATIGENMSLRRMDKVEGDTVVTYVHNAVADGMGKIGVVVAMTGGTEAFGRQVAMHIAAAAPAALSEAELDPAIVEKEKQVQMEIARESGKPEQVIEKMIEGRMKKWLAENTLDGAGLRGQSRPHGWPGRRRGGRPDHRFRASCRGRGDRKAGRGLRRRGGQDAERLSRPAGKVHFASSRTPPVHHRRRISFQRGAGAIFRGHADSKFQGRGTARGCAPAHERSGPDWRSRNRPRGTGGTLTFCASAPARNRRLRALRSLRLKNL